MVPQFIDDSERFDVNQADAGCSAGRLDNGDQFASFSIRPT